MAIEHSSYTRSTTLSAQKIQPEQLLSRAQHNISYTQTGNGSPPCKVITHIGSLFENRSTFGRPLADLTKTERDIFDCSPSLSLIALREEKYG